MNDALNAVETRKPIIRIPGMDGSELTKKNKEFYYFVMIMKICFKNPFLDKRLKLKKQYSINAGVFRIGDFDVYLFFPNLFNGWR